MLRALNRRQSSGNVLSRIVTHAQDRLGLGVLA